MRTFYFCAVSDPLFLGFTICAPSLDSAAIEYIKLYGFSPCVVFDASHSSPSRNSFISNLRFESYLKKSKLKTIYNNYSNLTQAALF